MRVPFDAYAKAYREFAVLSRNDGILEVRLHHDQGPARFGRMMHAGLPELFYDIASDVDTRIVVLTGTGDRFMVVSDMTPPATSVGTFTPSVFMPLVPEMHRLLDNFLAIEVPVICAVNGPVSVHAELVVLADIVVASTDAYFSDEYHFINGIVPGDGVQLIWPAVIGPKRAEYFLLTGQRIDGSRALDLGIVNEVVPSEKLLSRVRDLATFVLERPDVTLRATRQLFTQPFRRLLAEGLLAGSALEGLGGINHWPHTLYGQSDQIAE